MGSLVPGYPVRPEPEGPRKSLVLPPALDMGLLKVEDLEFDVEDEVARLRAAHAASSADREPEPRLAPGGPPVPRR